MDTPSLLAALKQKANLSDGKLAQLLGASLASVVRWERGAGQPSPSQAEQIVELHRSLVEGTTYNAREPGRFLARGIRGRSPGQGILGETLPVLQLAQGIQPPIITRLVTQGVFHEGGEDAIRELLRDHGGASPTAAVPFSGTISAGKNTYTYDAHTYHTKVPPQGISELLRYYLPNGGLVLDPFCGSGMTGVAASTVGLDCLLNELSPAACFIANRFTTVVNTSAFEAAVNAVMASLVRLREQLYSTECRECGRRTEVLYTVWSYRVVCGDCGFEFVLWDHCKKFGRIVREHKILTEFDCPSCGRTQRKSALARTDTVPVLIGYKCCGSRQQEVTCTPSREDLARIAELERSAPLVNGFYPCNPLPDGINLRQPAKHGLDRVDKFYSRRNLSALSHLWHEIHRVESSELAGHLAFVFTSLYQRVTRMSEFRFWGGSGNTARFNVPFIFNEANVFLTFQRKARTIQDHLESTARDFRGRVVVINGSATLMNRIPDSSMDLIFTDPPFGANINYSEMNLLWESWLGMYTDTAAEAIINRVQGKGIAEYESLMSQSLSECYRVLRPRCWMLLVFMNSSSEVWEALRRAIGKAGFVVAKIDMLDKQHGTFKQFVSENTAGMDLVLHCFKPGGDAPDWAEEMPTQAALGVAEFLRARSRPLPTNAFLHVGREAEIDYRTLYSEWLAQSFRSRDTFLDFATFRRIATRWLQEGIR